MRKYIAQRWRWMKLSHYSKFEIKLTKGFRHTHTNTQIITNLSKWNISFFVSYYLETEHVGVYHFIVSDLVYSFCVIDVAINRNYGLAKLREEIWPDLFIKLRFQPFRRIWKLLEAELSEVRKSHRRKYTTKLIYLMSQEQTRHTEVLRS